MGRKSQKGTKKSRVEKRVKREVGVRKRQKKKKSRNKNIPFFCRG